MASTTMVALASRTFEEILRTHPPAVSSGIGVLIDMALFWKAAGPERYFTVSEEFDQQLIHCYSTIYPAVSSERITPTPPTSSPSPLPPTLPLEHLGMILLDQYPRNAFRSSPKQYATDPLALKYANLAIKHNLDAHVEDALKPFFYLPFGHSESLQDQDTGVQLGEKIGGEFLKHAKEHRGVIRRFGRFCHRNQVLGRETTEEEKRFLAEEKPEWARS